MSDPNQPAPKDPGPKDPAKARWIAITLIRWTGVVLVLLGLLVYSRRIALPPLAGVVLLLIGLFDAFVMPTILARRWKTPPSQ